LKQVGQILAQLRHGGDGLQERLGLGPRRPTIGSSPLF
jgi:hypothetical protein